MSDAHSLPSTPPDGDSGTVGVRGAIPVSPSFQAGQRPELSSEYHGWKGYASLVPYGLAAVAPMVMMGGNIGTAGAIALSSQTLFFVGLILFVVWLLYKVLSSLLYAVVGIVVLGAVLWQFHLIPSQYVPVHLPPY